MRMQTQEHETPIVRNGRRSGLRAASARPDQRAAVADEPPVAVRIAHGPDPGERRSWSAARSGRRDGTPGEEPDLVGGLARTLARRPLRPSAA